jgi:hypothetical protein
MLNQLSCIDIKKSCKSHINNHLFQEAVINYEDNVHTYKVLAESSENFSDSFDGYSEIALEMSVAPQQINKCLDYGPALSQVETRSNECREIAKAISLHNAYIIIVRLENLFLNREHTLTKMKLGDDYVHLLSDSTALHVLRIKLEEVGQRSENPEKSIVDQIKTLSQNYGYSMIAMIWLDNPKYYIENSVHSARTDALSQYLRTSPLFSKWGQQLSF